MRQGGLSADLITEGKARKSPNGVTKFNKRPGHVIFRKESRRISAREKAPSWRFLAARSQIHAIGPHCGIFCQRRKECMPSTGFHTPSKAHFSASPLVPHLSTGFRMANRTNFFNKMSYTERSAHLRQASIRRARRCQPPERRLTARTCVSCRIDAMFA